MQTAVNTRGIEIPRTVFGRVTSDDLFEAREQALFDFYERNAGRYRRALDVGANIGIHSILMARQGWEVRAFEPDPVHFAELCRNAEHNHASVVPYRLALSDEAGDREFVRVLNNTTASHLAGAREFHGPVERIAVRAIEAGPFFEWADFAKIDVEGHEAALLRQWSPSQGCDLLVEIGSLDAARAIYDQVHDAAPMWRQYGEDWIPIRMFGVMPKHYREGALFIGERP